MFDVFSRMVDTSSCDFNSKLNTKSNIYIYYYTRVVLPWNKVEFSRNLLKRFFVYSCTCKLNI